MREEEVVIIETTRALVAKTIAFVERNKYEKGSVLLNSLFSVIELMIGRTANKKTMQIINDIVKSQTKWENKMTLLQPLTAVGFTKEVSSENLKFLSWKVESISTFKVDYAWCWELWTAGFHFGGRCKYESQEKAIEAAYHSIKHSNEFVNHTETTDKEVV
jgi:hypothetical protein